MPFCSKVWSIYIPDSKYMLKYLHTYYVISLFIHYGFLLSLEGFGYEEYLEYLKYLEYLEYLELGQGIGETGVRCSVSPASNKSTASPSKSQKNTSLCYKWAEILNLWEILK